MNGRVPVLCVMLPSSTAESLPRYQSILILSCRYSTLRRPVDELAGCSILGAESKITQQISCWWLGLSRKPQPCTAW
ncbi:hypothetical protein EDB89DRAFT_2024757 [Lactarius sanguifluus]|nr:hypothetical protein EDB89DRAFT_2024757 [Lactarius sanguifluus]